MQLPPRGSIERGHEVHAPMPLTTTHALVPAAAALAFTKRPLPWRLIFAAMAAAAFPDIDLVAHRLLKLPQSSIYVHRGAAHSLFVALAAGAIAAALHKRLKTSPLVAGVAIAAAMASHGLLDMMTDSDRPVAYLWPLSSVRLFADWRPIHSNTIARAQLVHDLLVRLHYELWQLIVPMFLVALAIRLSRPVLRRL